MRAERLVPAAIGATALAVALALALVAAASPPAAALLAALAVVGALTTTDGAAGYAARTAVIAAATLALLVLAAARPATAALCALGLAAAAWPVARPRVAALTLAGLAALAALVLCLTAWPTTTLLASAVLAVCVLAWRTPAAALVAALRLFGFAALTLAALAAPPALVLCLIAWPTTTLLASAVLLVCVLAWRTPVAALVAALGLFAFEGSFKVLITGEGTPFPGEPNAVAAALLDAALLAAVAGVLLHDRGRAFLPRPSLSRLERTVLVAFVAWLAVSVPQIALSGDLARGLDGFRLTHAYVLVALASFVVFRHAATAERALAGLLAGAGAACAYATFRVITGPSDSEQAYAIAKAAVVQYGDAFRAIGSFSSATGLASFAAPVAVFAIVVGALRPSARVLAWSVAVPATVALFGTLGRAPVLGLACGLSLAAIMFIQGSEWARARRSRYLLAAGLLVAVTAVGAIGTVVTGGSNSRTNERARAFARPASDESMRLRVKTWRRAIDKIGDRPLGRGLGTVGRATASDDFKTTVTTDNSYLKVFVEQGVYGGVLFLFGLLGLCVAAARRLGRSEPATAALGIAALSGFAAFLVMCVTGEYIELPGKAFAWALLGMAVAEALSVRRRESA
jgi:O-antigen ligase